MRGNLPKRAILRGDIYFAGLDPVIGSEQGGQRPVVILQNNSGNRYGPTVIVAPITSRVKPALPTHLPVEAVPALREGSVVLLEQLRTIDKSRLGQYMGSLGNAGMCALDAALATSLDLRRKLQPPVVMTLCARCASDFFDAGSYDLIRINPSKRVKERCTVCSTRTGYDYEVRVK
jgi:mRNA interferase MazF